MGFAKRELHLIRIRSTDEIAMRARAAHVASLDRNVE